MRKQSLIWKGIHAEQAVYATHFLRASCQESPRFRFSLPGACIMREHIRPVVFRIERDTEKNQVAPHTLLESLLEAREIVGKSQAKIRQRAPCINKIQRHNLAGKLAEADAPPILIGELEIRHWL